MKKFMAPLCVAAMVQFPYSLIGHAEEVEQTDQAIEESAEDSAEVGLEEVAELTLEDVLQRGIENDRNLTILQLNLEEKNNQILDSKYEKGDLTRDIKDVEDKIDDLKAERDALNDAAESSQNFQERANYMDSLETLEDQIESLETSILQLETGQLQLQLDEAEAKEGVRLSLTSSYANILTLQEQIAYTEKSLELAKDDLRIANFKYQQGGVSQEDVRLAEVDKTDLEKQLEEQQKEYNRAVADLCFSIGVSYFPDIVFKGVEIATTDFEQPSELDSLVENSYQFQRTQKDLESAILDRDEVYNDDDSSSYLKTQYDYRVKSQEETLASTKEDIDLAIEQLYHDAEMSYFSYEEALRQLENVKKEIEVSKIQYKFGGISKNEYERELILLDKEELAVFEAEIENYLLQQTIEALQKGYI